MASGRTNYLADGAAKLCEGLDGRVFHKFPIEVLLKPEKLSELYEDLKLIAVRAISGEYEKNLKAWFDAVTGQAKEALLFNGNLKKSIVTQFRWTHSSIYEVKTIAAIVFAWVNRVWEECNARLCLELEARSPASSKSQERIKKLSKKIEGIALLSPQKQEKKKTNLVSLKQERRQLQAEIDEKRAPTVGVYIKMQQVISLYYNQIYCRAQMEVLESDLRAKNFIGEGSYSSTWIDNFQKNLKKYILSELYGEYAQYVKEHKMNSEEEGIFVRLTTMKSHFKGDIVSLLSGMEWFLKSNRSHDSFLRMLVRQYSQMAKYYIEKSSRLGVFVDERIFESTFCFFSSPLKHLDFQPDEIEKEVIMDPDDLFKELSKSSLR